MDRLAKQPHVVAAAPAIFEQVLISRGPRARGAVLKGMIPKYERRVGDLLSSVKDGSAGPLDEASDTQPQPGLRPGMDGSETRSHTNTSDNTSLEKSTSESHPAGEGARSTQAEPSPDSL